MVEAICFFFSAIRNGNIEALVRMPIHQPGFHGSKPSPRFRNGERKKGGFFSTQGLHTKNPKRFG